MTLEEIVALVSEDYPLEHFPADGHMRELWQYDGGLDGEVIVVQPFINAYGQPSASIETDDRMQHMPMEDWTQEEVFETIRRSSP